jgi:hypothetical protein
MRTYEECKRQLVDDIADCYAIEDTEFKTHVTLEEWEKHFLNLDGLCMRGNTTYTYHTGVSAVDGQHMIALGKVFYLLRFI